LALNTLSIPTLHSLFDRFAECPFLLLQKLEVPAKHPGRLTMTSLAHSLFGPLKFSIDKVERDSVMFLALPHPRQAVIRTVVTRHRIRGMMKKEVQKGQKSTRNADPDTISGHGGTQPPPFSTSLVTLSGFHRKPRISSLSVDFYMKTTL
jgi:hypothetical protein